MRTSPFTPLEPLPAGSIHRSTSYGRRSFPTRDDYAAYFSELHSGRDPWADPAFAVAVMHDWHTRGQTGCLFARRLATVASDSRWASIVFPSPVGESLAHEVREKLVPALDYGIASPECEIVSLLFPRVRDVTELRALCLILTQASPIAMSTLEAPEGHMIVALRLDISGDGTLAWIMAFGPFSSWPPTRQGPLLEFSVRVKPKPETLFRMLNQDSSAAHLADSDPQLSESQMAKVFERTKMATRDVLGGDPDERTAAKATFSLPAAEWTRSKEDH